MQNTNIKNIIKSTSNKKRINFYCIYLSLISINTPKHLVGPDVEIVQKKIPINSDYIALITGYIIQQRIEGSMV